MAESVTYTIGELAKLAGVTPRTIRYYTLEGLLPRPEARGQYALYTKDHLLRLQLIARLKQAYLPLGEIKARIEQLGTEQVRALLAERDQPEPAGLSSAADYLSHVLSHQPAGQVAEARAQYWSAPEAEAGQAPAAQPNPPQAFAGQPDQPAPAAPTYGFALPAPAAPATSGAKQAEPQPNRLLQKLRQLRPPPSPAAPAEQPAQAAGEEHWRRIVLAPGIELHLREPLTATQQELIGRLIEQARIILLGGEKG